MYYNFDFFPYLYQQTSIPTISHDNWLIFLTCCRKVEVDRMMDVPQELEKDTQVVESERERLGQLVLH